MGFQSLGTPNCRSCSTQDELVASRLEAEELWCSWHLRFEVRRQCGHFLWSTMHSPAFPLDGRLRAACREEYCLDRAEPTEADTAKASLHTLFEKQGGSCSSFTRAMRGTPRWGSHPITPKEPSGKESLCEKGTHQTEMSRVRPHLIDPDSGALWVSWLCVAASLYFMGSRESISKGTGCSSRPRTTEACCEPLGT